MWLPLIVYLLLLGPPVALSVSPHIASRSDTITTLTTIQPDQINREACLQWWSEDGEEGTHCWPVDGESAPKHTFFKVILHTIGMYNFKVSLGQTSGIIQTPIQIVIVS